MGNFLSRSSNDNNRDDVFAEVPREPSTKVKKVGSSDREKSKSLGHELKKPCSPAPTSSREDTNSDDGQLIRRSPRKPRTEDGQPISYANMQATRRRKRDRMGNSGDDHFSRARSSPPTLRSSMKAVSEPILDFPDIEIPKFRGPGRSPKNPLAKALKSQSVDSVLFD